MFLLSVIYLCMHVKIESKARFSISATFCFAFVSSPGWIECDQVYEELEACQENPYRAYEILLKDLDDDKNT